MILSHEERRARLAALAKSEGFDSVDALLGAAVFDSVCPGICVLCGYTAEVEPDQRRGYCSACGGQTVRSALVLAGLV
jgi:hypothetical protein